MKKKNSKKKLKYNKFLSAKTLDILKEGESSAIQINKRKSKTKKTQINSQGLSLKKSSISMSKIIRKLPNDTKIEEKEKKADSKDNIKINKESDIKEDKKEEKEKDNRNIIELNEKINNLEILNEKDYIEEEENSPLLSKEQFNDILKKDKKRNKIFIIIIYIIIFIALIINIIKFTLSLIGFEASKNVLKTTICLEMLKIDIYVQGILSIIYCINENEQITELSNIYAEAKLKIKSTLDHLKILQNQINIIVNNKNCLGILNILESKILIKNLNEDWSTSTINIDLMEEIRSLTFKLETLANTSEICNITYTFYEFDNFTSDIYISGKFLKANEIQKVVYYFLSNIFQSYKLSFDKLIQESVSTIEKLWNIYQNNIFYTIISVSIIIIIFIIIFIIKKCFDFSYYKLLFLYYYNFENEQLKFENQIYYLYRTIHEFNSDNIDFLEYIKSNSHLFDYNEDINRNHSHYFSNKNINENRQSIVNHKKEGQKKNSIFNNIEYDKNKRAEQKSVNGSLLNGSMNGSSLQFLNASNKIHFNNNIENNSS